MFHGGRHERLERLKLEVVIWRSLLIVIISPLSQLVTASV